MTGADAQSVELTSAQQQLFEALAKNDTVAAKALLAGLNGQVNCLDKDGMTPLQHACCRGNKELVRLLLDMGADVHFHKHGALYSPLHFAAISGKVDVCRLLLDAGVDPNLTNSVSRTAAQMAAFVGNHACVETINNHLPRKHVAGLLSACGIPAEQLDAVHQFVTEPNLHPVRCALNLQTLGLLQHLPALRTLLTDLSDKHMTKDNVHELKSFKFHYVGWLVAELIKCEKRLLAQHEAAGTEPNKTELVELFIKRVLKQSKQIQQDYVECLIRECVREYRFRETAVFRATMTQLSAQDAPPALSVLRNAINGMRGFLNEVSFCSTCGNENPEKKCAKCKAVQYCDRECQRLHWFVHKKACARLAAEADTLSTEKPAQIDVAELQDGITKLKTDS